MDHLESFSSNMTLIFYGNNYALWSNRMQNYLLVLAVEVWLSIFNGYKTPKSPPTNLDENKLCRCNYKARHDFLNALSTIVQAKVICCNSTKEV